MEPGVLLFLAFAASQFGSPEAVELSAQSWQDAKTVLRWPGDRERRGEPATSRDKKDPEWERSGSFIFYKPLFARDLFSRSLKK
jgi:hypothetical protein